MEVGNLNDSDVRFTGVREQQGAQEVSTRRALEIITHELEHHTLGSKSLSVKLPGPPNIIHRGVGEMGNGWL